MGNNNFINYQGAKFIPIQSVKTLEKDDHKNALDMSTINMNFYQEIHQSSDEEDKEIEEIENSGTKLINQSEKDLQKYLIIFTTKKEIYLLNSNLEILDWITFDPGFPIVRLLGLQKLSMMEYLPELSTLLVGTHLKKIILFVRIVKDTKGDYKLIPEQKIQNDSNVSLFVGMGVKKIQTFNNQFRYHVYMTDLDHVEIYEISSKESEIMNAFI